MSSPFDDDTFGDNDSRGLGSDQSFGNDPFFNDAGVSTNGPLGGVAGAFAASANPIHQHPHSSQGGMPPGGGAPSGGSAPAGSTPVSSSRSAAGLAEEGGSDRNNVITARGTSEGLVLRIDGRVQPSDLLPAVKDFLASRRSFLAGHDVAFEWVGKKADEGLISDLTAILLNDFSITVRSSRLRTNQGATPLSKAIESIPQQEQFSVSSAPASLSVVGGGRSIISGASTTEKSVSLFDGMEGYDAKAGSSGNSMLWDDPDARVIYGTLRSGQKVETEHSVVIFGDVNSGAEVIAGGDIVILGTLRGIAHAGAYDESGGGRVIFALNLQPTQLRIGLVISRGASGDMRPGAGDKSNAPSPEIARVDNNMIVVELYQSRTVWVRRRE